MQHTSFLLIISHAYSFLLENVIRLITKLFSRKIGFLYELWSGEANSDRLHLVFFASVVLVLWFELNLDRPNTSEGIVKEYPFWHIKNCENNLIAGKIDISFVSVFFFEKRKEKRKEWKSYLWQTFHISSCVYFISNNSSY